MTLQDLHLKDEYRSDRDDFMAEFFIPCISNCMQYDVCVEYVSLKSLTALVLGFDNFVRYKAKMRIVSGHKFGAYDLEMISKVFTSESRFVPKNIRDNKIEILRQLVNNGQLEIKVAVVSSEEMSGTFAEKTGIFTDEHGDSVAYTGDISSNGDIPNRKFGIIDVFTSWNDKSRIDTKMKNFEDLWANRTRYLQVCSFEDAVRNNIVRYSLHWATPD